LPRHAGWGREIAEALAAEDAAVVLTGRTDAEGAARAIAASGGQVHGIRADLHQKASSRRRRLNPFHLKAVPHE
jgi:NAD(P)-dependent dehydrogenase (short-subunit alcohol dehydrogenase family)